MDSFLPQATAWLRRRAENVAVALLAAMFLAFIIQIVFRYLFNWPIGWTTEVCVIAWLWVVLWTSSFVLKDSEEICFDLISGAVGPKIRRYFKVIGSAGLVALYAISLPASVDYVSFMKVEKTSYMGVRFDYLFVIYIVFAGAIIIRYGWAVWRGLRGDPDDETVDKPSGGAE